MLDVVIVNWNAGNQLRQCVDSVLAYGAGFVRRVIIVDNGSTDGSADVIDGFPDVMVIRLNANIGFAAACNLGAQAGNAPYVLFLNPDTRLFSNSISVPIALMKQPENADVGICGIQLLDEEGRVSRSCARFPTLVRFILASLGLDKLPSLSGAAIAMRDWDHTHTRTVDHVMGAFFLVRRDLFERLGGFDERFFVYLEDVDFSFRAHQAGLKSIYLADACAFHAGGGTSRQVKARRLFYSLRSKLLYGFKHFPRWQSWILACVTCLIEPLTRTLYCAVRGDLVSVRYTWDAYRMLWRGLSQIVRGEGRF